MQVSRTIWNGRAGWALDNGHIRLVVLAGGGHLASLTLHAKPEVNPYWTPQWPSVEPWKYRPAPGAATEARLLASLCGHNLCLGWFGGPSEAEARAGLGAHGEAGVVRWKLLGRRVWHTGMELQVIGCELPVAQMHVARAFCMRPGSGTIHVREQIRNLSRRDIPYTVCQHVTLGAPFLAKGVTAFDMSATRGHTFPEPFGRQRLRVDTAFRWPNGPGVDGETVDLRTIGRKPRRNGDYSVQLMNPRREDAWFSAVNPRLGVLFACSWRRADYPWLGNWEENLSRKGPPWAGRELARGMEFANTPFPQGLRAAVDRGRFHGLPTYAWLPALATVTTEYDIHIAEVPRDVRGVRDVRRHAGCLEPELQRG